MIIVLPTHFLSLINPYYLLTMFMINYIIAKLTREDMSDNIASKMMY